MELLTEQEISQRLGNVPHWKVERDAILRDLSFADFPQAMAFVNRVAEAAERAGHHPNIDIRWNKVKLTLSSHDAGGLTVADFNLAAVIDELV